MVDGIGIYREPRPSRKKKWVVRWHGDYRPDTGKQIWYSKAFALKIEAEEFYIKKKREFAKGQPHDKVKPRTICDFCRSWLANRDDLRPASHELYNITIRRLEDFFGPDHLLQGITSEQADRFIKGQKNLSVTKTGKDTPLSDWSIAQLRRQCRTIFTAAGVGDNPFKQNGRHNKRPAVKRWHRITVEQYHSLLNVAPDLRWQAFYALAYTSGLRLGELFSLTWDDVDFEKAVVRVDNREGNDYVPPFYLKDNEKRQIPLPEHTLNILAEWHSKAPEGVPFVLLDKNRYEIVKAKWHKLRKERKPWRNGYMMNNVLREFKRHCKRAGIKPDGKLSIHTLRKSCALNWADNLPMHVVKAFMGHSSITTTQEFYTQVDSTHQAMAAKKIQELLESNTKRQ